MEVILTKAFTMVGIIMLGYILKAIGFLDKAHFRTLSKLSISITLPCVIIGKFSQFEMNYAFLVFIFIGLGLNLMTNAFGYVVGSKGGKQSKAFYMVNLSGFNVGAFALPFVQNFIGAEGVVAACLFDCGNSMMCTGGTYALASSVAAVGEKQNLKTFLKKLFSSIPLDTYLIMLVLCMLHIKLPAPILSFASTIAGANSFLAMTVIGLGFEWKLQRSQVKAAGICLGFRYTMSLLLAFLFYRYLPFSLEVRQTMVMIAFAPLSALCPVYTQWCGGDESLASTINSLTILISSIALTVLLLVFNM